MIVLNLYADHQQELRIGKFYIHPDWDAFAEKYDADVAILETTTTVEFTLLVRPVCLPSDLESVDELVGTSGNVAGWGSYRIV